MKYGLSDKQLQEITGIISSYPQIEHAFIFGSRAINTYKEASDIDIAIKGSKVDSSLAAKLKDYLEEDTYLPFFFDVVAYNSIQSEELKKHIRTKGKAIYSKELEGWREVRLGEICTDISYGYTASAKNEAIGPKFLRITDIVPDRISWKDVPYCEISEKNTTKYKLEIGDIVIARTGATTGYNGIINTNLNCVFASYLIRYRIDPLIAYPFYVGYVLRSLFWKGFVNGVVGGSAQPGANAKQFAGFKFYLPPLPEQKAIAEVLSSLDDKIDLLHRQNKTLEDMAQTLFRKWFIDEADEDWEVGKIPDEFDFIMGQSPPGESYNEDKNGTPMFQGNADFSFRFPTNRIYTTQPKRLAEKYDILISVRAPVGEQNMAKEKCCIGRGVAAFRYKNDRSFYTYTYFKMMSLTKKIKQYNQTGTVFGSISKSDFQNMEVTIPPIELIKKFQEIAKPIDEKIISNQSQIHTLENLLDTLLPKLMSGKVRINV